MGLCLTQVAREIAVDGFGFSVDIGESLIWESRRDQVIHVEGWSLHFFEGFRKFEVDIDVVAVFFDGETACFVVDLRARISGEGLCAVEVEVIAHVDGLLDAEEELMVALSARFQFSEVGIRVLVVASIDRGSQLRLYFRLNSCEDILEEAVITAVRDREAENFRAVRIVIRSRTIQDLLEDHLTCEEIIHISSALRVVIQGITRAQDIVIDEVRTMRHFDEEIAIVAIEDVPADPGPLSLPVKPDP